MATRQGRGVGRVASRDRERLRHVTPASSSRECGEMEAAVMEADGAERNGGNRDQGGTGTGTGEPMEDLMRTGQVLLLDFVRDRVQRCEDPAVRELGRAALGGQQEWSPQTQKLGELLRRVGDELDGNVELQRMISQVGCTAPREVFFRVAKEMFADNTFNWGRVVALFYFACKLVIKALYGRLPQVVQTLLDWTGQFIKETVLAWIKAQGGWDALLSAFGPPTWRNVTISAAIIITASFTLWKMA